MQKRGVHPTALLQPASTELFDRFYDAARGHIRLMTVAPELPGALELIAHASGRGRAPEPWPLGCACGRRRARALPPGAVSATHTFNAMRELGHREPGMLGVVLDCRRSLCGS